MKEIRTLKISKDTSSHNIKFNAMASACEVIIETRDRQIAQQVAECVTAEVWRVEDKFSRYDNNSVCSKINTSAGKQVSIDEETYLLLNFAEQCYQLSAGLFDISSGVLRKIWSFDALSGECKHFPTEKEVEEMVSLVNWESVVFDQNSINLPRDMEVDFGGIGKEYAVDRAILLAKKITDVPILVNLGGDMAVTGPRLNNQAWQVAIEHPDSEALGQKQDMIIALNQGALATSGDARRYIMREGIRYGHVLNAKTGWPILGAPRSITTAAPQCIQAGILATLALLQGQDAEQFLNEQEITFWARR